MYLFKKYRKRLGDIIILHMCTKHLDDKIYSSWDIECDRLKLAIMGHFLPFFKHTSQKNIKIRILKKNEKKKKKMEILSF